MLLIYDHENVLHITNEKGLRWNYDKADKPQFTFDYDYLFYIEEDNLYEIEINDSTEIMSDEQKVEVEEYINLLEPPLSLTLAKQYIDDIRNETKDRVLNALSMVNDHVSFHDRGDLMIAGREGSQDPRRQTARRVMEFQDFAYGLSERIIEELKETLDEDLKDFNHYLDGVVIVPPVDHFFDEVVVDERFNTDTLDVHGGEDDLGFDKKAV